MFKRHYHILTVYTFKDFAILVENDLPEPNHLNKEETVLEKAASWLGVPTFLKKHRITGIIIAILFLPDWAPMGFNIGNDVVATT